MKLRHKLSFLLLNKHQLMKLQCVLINIVALALTASQSFAQSIELSPPKMEETSFLQDEASISAYMQTNQSIEINTIVDAFRTIEQKTENYIIGSVSLAGYDETHDVHVYLDTQGWIIAYYLRSDPTAKIIDWAAFDENEAFEGTKLEKAISVVCNYAGIPAKNIDYYHFAYPESNKLLIVADALWERGDDTFELKLPSDFIFKERSYSHSLNDELCGSKMFCDEEEISSLSQVGTNYGILSPTQLALDEFHIIKVTLSSSFNRFGPALSAIALIYSEQN